MKRPQIDHHRSYQKFSKIRQPEEQKKEFSVSSSKSKKKNENSFSFISSVSLHNSKISSVENASKDPNLLYPKAEYNSKDSVKEISYR